MAETIGQVDFAVAAFHSGGEWRVAELAHDLPADVEALTHALRRFPADGGAVALIALDEADFLILRVDGSTPRILLSDAGAAEDWDLADSALDYATLDDEFDEGPVGDLTLLSDLGVPAAELAELLDDAEEDDLFPEELMSDLARMLGFGELFDDAVGLSPA